MNLIKTCNLFHITVQSDRCFCFCFKGYIPILYHKTEVVIQVSEAKRIILLLKFSRHFEEKGLIPLGKKTSKAQIVQTLNTGLIQ